MGTPNPTPRDLDRQRSEAIAMAAARPMYGQTLALVYLGDCIRYQAEMAVWIAENRPPGPAPMPGYDL